MMKKIELLSPAGDLERLKVTLLYGADACYIGGKKYSLRANATNFSLEEIKEATMFAHKLGKRIYLTLNIVFHNEDYTEVLAYISDVVNAGIDAFIVSDLYLVKLIKENYPVEVHLSTQNSTFNYEAALFYKELGVDRIVLARELSKIEIKEIIDKTNIDIEVFIHGAMCSCISGRCMLSNYVTKRDANRGGCAQVCRFSFETGNNDVFTMAPKDLNMALYIKDLIDIGVISLKVEGRMRSLYYLATVISSYRKIIDGIINKTITKELLENESKILNRVSNREVSSHFFTKYADFTDQYYTGRSEVSNQDYLGVITGYDKKNKCLILKERNYFKCGDKVEIFTPNLKRYKYTIDKIYDEDMNELEVARHPEQVLKLKFEEELEEYSMIRLEEKDELRKV